MRWHLPSLLAGLAAALLAADASATVMLRATLEELAKESDLVLRAEVVSTEGLPTSDGKRIFTRVVLAAGEAYKGTPPAKVVVHDRAAGTAASGRKCTAPRGWRGGRGGGCCW